MITKSLKNSSKSGLKNITIFTHNATSTVHFHLFESMFFVKKKVVVVLWLWIRLNVFAREILSMRVRKRVENVWCRANAFSPVTKFVLAALARSHHARIDINRPSNNCACVRTWLAMRDQNHSFKSIKFCFYSPATIYSLPFRIACARAQSRCDRAKFSNNFDCDFDNVNRRRIALSKLTQISTLPIATAFFPRSESRSRDQSCRRQQNKLKTK